MVYDDEDSAVYILNTEELAMELIHLLEEDYPGMLKGFYQSEEVPFEKYPEKPEAAILEAIASVRGCLAKGGEIDFLKAANLLLENFRNGKIGRITLERPDSEEA